MNDLIDICKITNIKLDDLEVYNKKIDIVRLRTRVGMVFQKPNLFQNQFMTTLLMDLNHGKVKIYLS